jgi:tetratricopeptide (TPR) repeat protein
MQEDGESALELADQSITIAKQIGADEARLAAYNYRGCALVVLGDLDAGIEWMDRGYTDALARGHPSIAAPAMYNAAIDRLLALRAAEIPGLADLMTTLPATPEWELMIAFLRGEADLFLGRLPDAVLHYESSVELARRHGMAVFETWGREALALALCEQDRLVDAAALLTRPIEEVGTQDVVGWAVARLRLFLARGDREAALDVARQAAARGSWAERAPVVVVPLVEAFLAAGQVQEAFRATNLTDSHPPDRVPNPWLEHATGLLALSAGDGDGALARLSRAGARFETAGYALDAIRVKLASGQALAGLGRDGEAGDARNEAIAAAKGRGAALLVRQASALL